MIGIYGGTFDPLHFGHLRTAVEVKEALSLDELRLTPCGMPAHRHRPVASPLQRQRMLEMVLERNPEPGLRLDDRELRRSGPSYMVDTLRSLRDEYPHASLCLVVGADAFQGLDRWSRWESLFELAHLVVMVRPEAGVGALSKALEQQLSIRKTNNPLRLRETAGGYIYEVAVTQLAISATRIRQLIASGASIRYLLPDNVLEYIQAEGLYR